MVYLNRFLCVDAGMLAEPMRLQRVKCHMITRHANTILILA